MTSAAPSTRRVQARLDGAIGRITLADPDHRNALSRELSDDLAAAVHSLLADDARVLVLDAEPPVFCAGGSLDGLIERTHPLAASYAGFTALADAPVPTIAAVCGPAIGAERNLPLACDVVLAGESARFDPRFLDVGIHPGGGHLWRLAERVGEQGAAALVLCGDSLTGAEAAAKGLAWRCVPDDDLPALATAFAERVAGRSPELVRLAKATLRASRALSDPADAAAVELAAQEWSVAQPYFRETVTRLRDRVRSRR
ncbi:enoyl-CoA hydratase-related protein [Cryptosporangium minutisporangium]|uniref:enoyl-CoA hydratase-related protein n=1 Tax=Cryptosporangium minutisporangium TaxID=113569 RepID=UPI0035EB4CEC